MYLLFLGINYFSGQKSEHSHPPFSLEEANRKASYTHAELKGMKLFFTKTLRVPYPMDRAAVCHFCILGIKWALIQTSKEINILIFPWVAVQKSKMLSLLTLIDTSKPRITAQRSAEDKYVQCSFCMDNKAGECWSPTDSCTVPILCFLLCNSSCAACSPEMPAGHRQLMLQWLCSHPHIGQLTKFCKMSVLRFFFSCCSVSWRVCPPNSYQCFQ